MIYTESEVKTAILNKVDEIIDEAIKLFGVNIGELKVRFDVRGRVAGNACYSLREVNYNMYMATRNMEEFLKDTVPHEVAHIITHAKFPYAKPHGREWKWVMIKLGYNPTRTHSFEYETARKTQKQYLYKCTCNSYWLSSIRHNKMVAGTKHYICTKCRSNIVYQNTTK